MKKLTPSDRSNPRRSRKRKTPPEVEQREKSTKEFLQDLANRAIALRNKDREFHGLEREFLYCQLEMQAAYEKSKDIKHPRDVGDMREEILRKFLLHSGYLPKRYGISQNSARVASTTGHISKEIDIALYDPLDSLCLMNREGVYSVFPVESVYGVIQIKSRLNKTEIRDGLENLASFKQLQRRRPTPKEGFFFTDSRKSEQGFGLLFAYDSDLEWLDIIHEAEAFAKEHPNTVWCNGVFILNKGSILYGEENSGAFTNTGLEKIKALRMFGFLDRHNQCLYQFISVLFELLRNTNIHPAELTPYFRLPLVAETHSYAFCLGDFFEFATCEKHGDYQRKIAPDQLTKLISWCSKAEPINWIRATDIAYGKPGDDTEAYARQPGDVRIYNPENLPLSEILVRDPMLGGMPGKALAFDTIQCTDMVIYIPYYYSAKEHIIGSCPKCEK